MSQEIQNRLKELKQIKNLRELKQHQVLNDYVLATPVDFEFDGVVYDPKQYEDKPEYAMVISVGDKVTEVKEDDFIVFEKYSALNMRVNEIDFIFIKEYNVISKYAGQGKI